MFDKAEQDFKELSEKKRIVENDKDKIHQARTAQGLKLRGRVGATRSTQGL